MAFDENTPLAANQVANDLTAINANWEYLISGDGTAGRVLRVALVTVDDATDAGELKCTVASLWNGDAIAETDNIGKGETVGNFTLNAGGDTLTIEAAGLSGNAVAVLSTDIHQNLSTTALDVLGYVVANDITLVFYGAGDGLAKDATTLVDTGAFKLVITYITSA